LYYLFNAQIAQELDLTQQPPAQAVGLDKRDTGHKTRLCLRPKIIITLRFEVMFQIILKHLFGQLTRSRTKVASCPKVSSPILLFQIGKTFKHNIEHLPLIRLMISLGARLGGAETKI